MPPCSVPSYLTASAPTWPASFGRLPAAVTSDNMFLLEVIGIPRAFFYYFFFGSDQAGPVLLGRSPKSRHPAVIDFTKCFCRRLQILAQLWDGNPRAALEYSLSRWLCSWVPPTAPPRFGTSCSFVVFVQSAGRRCQCRVPFHEECVPLYICWLSLSVCI